MEFFGRSKERNVMQMTFSSDVFESVLVYGRRRVGKSELIKKSISEANYTSIFYECKQTTEKNNVESISKLISEKLKYPKLAFSTMEEVLEFLFERAQNEKMIVVLDEYSYIRDSVKGMDSVLQSLIDRYRENTKIKLIICGSYVDIMQSLVFVHNPLYGRFTRIIDLKQMDYYDTAKFYKGFTNEDKIALYSVFGGIPYYNRLIDCNLTVKENIIHLIASQGARLEVEVTMYLQSEISKIVNVNEVFEALAMGSHKYSDIYAKSHVSSRPTLIDVLDKLIKMEVVEKRAPINDEHNKKKSGYYISDNLSYFYYRYIFRYLSQMSVMESSTFYDTYIKKDFETQYIPHMFENICKQFLVRSNRSNMLETPFYKIGKYYYDDPESKTNGEFDVVTQDAKGFIFYECKYQKTIISYASIQQEIEQVKKTGLNCYKYGFFLKNGIDKFDDTQIILYHIDDLFL